MTISAGFCDGRSPTPIVQQLEGIVNLSNRDWVSIASALYALRVSVPLLT